MNIVDLFSGCGGMSLGFERAGYNVVAAYDNWEKAVEVYKKNFNHPIFNINLGDLEDYSHIQQFNPDIIIGGPPCQDFSSAGKRDETLGRSDLTIKFAEIIAEIKPQYVVMENVARVETSNAYSIAKNILIENNYGITTIVLDASLCGVPQKRKRFFLIGELEGQHGAVEPYLTDRLAKKSMTVRDYLGESLNTEHYYRHPRNYNRRGVFSIDEPSPTIRGVNRPIPQGYPGHKADSSSRLEEVRSLTSIERSLIQTFPPNFFDDALPKTHLDQMIGNAVPVNLAQYVALGLKNYINKKKLPTLTNKQIELFV